MEINQRHADFDSAVKSQRFGNHDMRLLNQALPGLQFSSPNDHLKFLGTASNGTVRYQDISSGHSMLQSISDRDAAPETSLEQEIPFHTYSSFSSQSSGSPRFMTGPFSPSSTTSTFSEVNPWANLTASSPSWNASPAFGSGWRVSSQQELIDGIGIRDINPHICGENCSGESPHEPENNGALNDLFYANILNHSPGPKYLHTSPDSLSSMPAFGQVHQHQCLLNRFIQPHDKYSVRSRSNIGSWTEAPISTEVEDEDTEWPDWSRWDRRESAASSSAGTLSTRDDNSSRYSADSVGYSASSSGSSLSPPRRESQSSTFARHCVECSPDAADSTVEENKVVDFRVKPHLLQPSASMEAPKPNLSDQSPLHPAKTGFALWVGNLGSRTTLADLCKLFGTPELQSIYLIQRTGCAFVNYKNRSALEYGMSLFQRRGGRLHDHELVIKAQISDDSLKSSSQIHAPCNDPLLTAEGADFAENRYFICKSLTVDDLELAKEQGFWSTQLRNKDRLNNAFRNSKNTYLIFSANRTSAFYGVARLEAEFCDQGADDLGKVKSTVLEDAVPAEITPTLSYCHPADGVTIPGGVTVLDPLRGSQFWKVSGCACIVPEAEKWTAPARITWLSPSSGIVPFCRTRQLKNSLNSNKPVKVARDGTEIDPIVGTQLYHMFDI